MFQRVLTKKGYIQPVSKVGGYGTIAIAIPPEFAVQLALDIHSYVEVVLAKDTLVIRKSQKPPSVP